MRSRVMPGIRPIDTVMAGILGVLAAVLAVMNIENTDTTIRVDSQSWLQLPLFVATVLPLLWWRRSLVAVLLASCGLMLVHLLTFGHLVRCGAGLPLVFVLAFLCGLAAVGQAERLADLGLTLVLSALVLAWDTAAGPELLPVVALIAAGLYGIGRVVAHRGPWVRSFAGATRTFGCCVTSGPPSR